MNDINTKSLFISVVGKPNVGKSSLVNMVVNSKISIVSPKPQTTRDKILGIFTNENTQLVFIDTPGLLQPKNRLGDYMVSQINSSFSGAEAILHVVEVGNDLNQLDEKLIEKFKKVNIPVVLVINKIDLLKDKTLLIEEIDKWRKEFSYAQIIPISAKTGDGREILIKELSEFAMPSVFFFDKDDITDRSVRNLTADIIREKLLYFLDKELPHGVAVSIEKFKHRNDTLVDIDAVIYCEKSNHKSIIIGKNGSMIKNVGTEARKDLEQMIDCKVNLKLWVKVKENWRNRESILNSLGYKEFNMK
ncbi:MAG: GTPase Era [Clostridia bacterium]|nr:GTPase Era [Clostridia bacterium]